MHPKKINKGKKKKRKKELFKIASRALVTVPLKFGP